MRGRGGGSEGVREGDSFGYALASKKRQLKRKTTTRSARSCKSFELDQQKQNSRNEDESFNGISEIKKINLKCNFSIMLLSCSSVGRSVGWKAHTVGPKTKR